MSDDKRNEATVEQALDSGKAHDLLNQLGYSDAEGTALLEGQLGDDLSSLLRKLLTDFPPGTDTGLIPRE
jgi:hypothetical protein